MALSVGSSQHSRLLLCGSQEGKSDSREAEFMSCNPKTSYHFFHVLLVMKNNEVQIKERGIYIKTPCLTTCGQQEDFLWQK